MPPVPLTYTAWGAAERAFWQPDVLEQRAEFWKSKLAGHATDLERADHTWAAAAMAFHRFPRDLANETRELARRTRITLFSTLLRRVPNRVLRMERTR